nr:ribonuclease P protein subunit RPR2 [Hymenolepis microstoma]
MGKKDRSKTHITPIHLQIDILYRQAYSCVHPLLNCKNEVERQVIYSTCRRCVRQLLLLAKKSRVRLSPVMRRSICRGCHLILDSRVTSRLKMHSSGIIVTCETCGTRNITSLQPNKPYRPSYFERTLPDSKIPVAEID